MRGQIVISFVVRSAAVLSIAALSAGLSMGLVLLALGIHGSWRYPFVVMGALAILFAAAALMWLVGRRYDEEYQLRAVVWRVVAGLPLAFLGPFKPLLIPIFVVGVLLLGSAASIAVTLTRKQMKERRAYALALALLLSLTALFVLAADWGVLIRFLSGFDPSPN